MDQSLLLGVATSAFVILAVASLSPKAKPQTKSTCQRHQLTLPSGRNVAYYTFGSKIEGHPILYLNGFPGTGMESSVYGGAQHAPHQLVGIDRPGMGYTSNEEDSNEDPFATCCNDIWALAEHLKWESFSVIGLSGGGPHAVALLASYLSSSDKKRKPKIGKVALVSGLCMSGGTDGMMEVNQQSAELVKSYPNNLWSRLQLSLVYMTICFFLPLLPDKVVHYIIQSDKGIPKADQVVVAQQVEGLTEIGRHSLRQGAQGPLADLRRCFAVHAGSTEAILKECYGSREEEDLPEVHILHGKLDRNVPFGHSQYMHEQIFHKKSKLTAFDHHGHFSLIVEESKTYVKSVQ